MRPTYFHTKAGISRIGPAILLTCCIGLAASCSDDSSTEPAAPTVTAGITSPPDGSTYVEGDDIRFTGSGTTSEGDDLTGFALVWTSSLSGQIGTGGDFTADLDEGQHVIRLTASTNDGVSGADSVAVTVLQGVTAEITAPADGAVFVLGDEIEFTGTGADPSGTALTGSSLVWTRTGDGDPMGTGESITRSLPLGDFEVTLTATDDEMHTGSDKIDISVVSPVTVQITSPTAEGSYDENTPILLTGSAETYLGEPLTGDSLAWNVNGYPAGTGASVEATLPEGSTTVTLIATDGLGRTGGASVTVTVDGDGVQFNLTGTWSFSANTPTVQGAYFTADGPLTGFCDIIQVGAVVNLVFTDGYLPCDPVWICEFDGSGSNLDYEIANSGPGDLEGETLTNVIRFQSVSATYLDGTQQSVYQYADGVSTSSLYISHFSFSRVPD